MILRNFKSCVQVHTAEKQSKAQEVCPTIKVLPCKSKDLSSNPQSPFVVCFHNHGSLVRRSEVETGESLETFELASLYLHLCAHTHTHKIVHLHTYQTCIMVRLYI